EPFAAHEHSAPDSRLAHVQPGIEGDGHGDGGTRLLLQQTEAILRKRTWQHRDVTLSEVPRKRPPESGLIELRCQLGCNEGADVGNANIKPVATLGIALQPERVIQIS